jgi:hypothetical protein
MADIFVLKLNSFGDLIWNKQFLDGVGISLVSDKNSNIYITGLYSGTRDFNSGPFSHYITSNGSLDIFILKLNSNGSFVWVKSIGNTNVDRVKNIAIDDAGYIYITGTFYNTLDLILMPELII